MEIVNTLAAAKRRPPPLRRLPKAMAGGALALVTSAGLIWFMGRGPHGQAQARPDDSSEAVVAVSRIERADLAREITIQAEFRPMQEIDLHAKVAGYLQKILVDIGDHVEAGQLIAVLENPELQADFECAQARVKRSQAEVKRAEAAYHETHLAFTRLSSVNQDQPNLIAEQEIDTALAKDIAAASTLAAASQQVQVAQSEAEKFGTLLRYSRITAPFAGVITKRFADPGALIQAGISSSTQAMPLVRLSENARLRLVFPVSVSYVSYVKAGDPVEIEVESLQRSLRGVVARFSRSVDTATRTMNTEVDVQNPDLSLIPGAYATVRLTLDRRQNVLAAPVQAVSQKSPPTVLVVSQDGVIEERQVTLGMETPQKVELLSGVRENELVLIGSRALVKLGQKVIAKPVVIDLSTPSPDKVPKV
jgi:RND family efflux transporter MFP subunit